MAETKKTEEKEPVIEVVEEKPAESEEKKSSYTKKKKSKRQIQRGQAHIQCTYNNTIVSISDMGGAILGWTSSGALGFKGPKKATPYAATQVVSSVVEKVSRYGIKELDVFVKGVGSGRESAIRTLVNKGFNLLSIKDITPIPHNGCRPRKPRRV